MVSASTTGNAHLGGDHERLEGVGAADLEGHDRVEGAAQVLLHLAHGQRRDDGVGETFLAHQRRAHGGDHRHQGVVVQLGGVQELDPAIRPGTCVGR